MKKLSQIVFTILALTLVGTEIAMGQDAFSSINLSSLSENGVLELSGTNISSFQSLSDDELTTLVGGLDAVATVPMSSLPTNRWGGVIGGTFWSLQNPGQPPLPTDTIGVDVWPMADGSFLLNDLDFDYSAASASPMHMGAMDAEGIFPSGDTNIYTANSDFPPFIPGTNLWIATPAVAGGYLTGIGSNTVADVPYEILSRTNLAQTDWQSLGFIFGSELTNWTPISIAQNGQTSLYFRLRSWVDSYDIGIPDWWQIYYFGTNGIDPNASPANDGFSNLQKFQMGLNPTNYFNPNGPPGFFGYLDATGTNVFIAWNAASGPVLSYSIQRGVSNSLTGQYAFSQISTVISNANFIKDGGAINSSNALNDVYQLEAVYPGNSLSATDTWQVSWFSQYGSLGLPYGPPMPTNFYACADTSATNVLLSWTPASGVATNYLIERGIYSATSNTWIYHQIASVNPATNSITVSRPFTNSANWSDDYAIVAVYPGNVPAPWAISPVNVGNTNGMAGPGSFFGYADGTGTNLELTWTAAAGSATNYIIFAGNTNAYGTCAFVRLTSASGGSTSVLVTNGYINLYQAYAIFAVYTNGGMSQAAFWQSAIGTPAPANFIAYFDATGTNVWLAWSAPTGAISGYLITRFDPLGDIFQYTVNTNNTWFEDTNAVNTGSFDPDYTQYTIQSIYPRGGLSSTALAMVGSVPAPTDLSAALDVTGKNVIVTWNAVPGATGYTIDRGVLNPASGTYSYSPIATVGANVTSYTDTAAINGANSYNNQYEVEAIFPGNVDSDFEESAVSESSDIPLSNIYITANLIRNGSGHWQVMFSGLPTNGPQVVQLTWNDGYEDIFQTNLTTTTLTNGIFPIPDAFAVALLDYEMMTGFALELTAQLFGPNGEPGQIGSAGFFANDAPYFVDGRRHMKQNLIFLLSAAPNNQLFFSPSNASFGFFGNNNSDGVGGFNESPTNFEEFGFLHHLTVGGNGEDLNYFQLDDLWPFTANYGLANYLVDTTRTTNGGPTSPTYATPYGLTNFYFQPNFATNIPAPPILALPNPCWILQPGVGNNINGMGGSPSSDWALSIFANDTSASLGSGAHNLFGLLYNNGSIVSQTNGSIFAYQTLSTGGNVTTQPGYQIDDYASWTAAPTLLLSNYYFAPLLATDQGISDAGGRTLPGEFPVSGIAQPFPVPINEDFNVTNQTPPIIASVGQPMIVGGWAKYSVGSSGKFAYLGQYFQTNVFLINSNGVVTTNNAGVMSPYGEFFPLQAGLAQFTTMGDIDNPSQQGTNFVRIISLNVDANHDGTMDLTYKGPDFVSASKPFRFWVNDNQDAGDFGGNFGVPGQGTQGDGLQQDRTTVISTWPMLLASSFPNGNYSVHGRRDLVDFFPVYLNIGSLFQSNALSAGISATDTNWQFVLSQADSALRYAYTGLTPTNYMNFLRDTNVSGLLASAPLVTISNSGAILPPSFVSAIATNNLGIILVEAAVPTTQPLVLTVYHGTNQIAQTSLPLSITGVEQMFRSKTMMLNPAEGTVPDRLTDASVPNEPDTIDKNFVFMHGYNVNPNEARGVAADMYKRMYWSGSHAKFWAVTWEGADTKGTPPFYDLLTPNYHTNVGNAFMIAPLLANFIASLTNSGPVVAAAHSLGNMLTLSAISDWNAPISQFFMMDAAVPIEAIDPSSSTNVMILSTWTQYTNRLYASKWYALFPTNDARSTLTWQNRLGNLNNVDVYNFYSSGEEVLREYDPDPPGNLQTVLETQLADAAFGGVPFGTYTWVWQEKGKGSSAEDWLIGSSHGGWLLSPAYYSGFGYLSPSNAALLSVSQLQTNPFCYFGSSLTVGSPPNGDLVLTNAANGSAYAQANRNRILSDAIPALSLVLGANPVPDAGIVVQNIDMMTLENGWPQGRLDSGEKNNNWHHSDFVQMADTFTYRLFNQFVTLGNLK